MYCDHLDIVKTIDIQQFLWKWCKYKVWTCHLNFIVYITTYMTLNWLKPHICFSDVALKEDPEPNQERKFIVYESCLRMLFVMCTICFLPCNVILKSCKGSMVTILSICTNGHEHIWKSQPSMGTLPRGNLDIASAILFSGSTAAKVINMMRHCQLYTITTKTFTRLQKYYLIPAVLTVSMSNYYIKCIWNSVNLYALYMSIIKLKYF